MLTDFQKKFIKETEFDSIFPPLDAADAVEFVFDLPNKNAKELKELRVEVKEAFIEKYRNEGKKENDIQILLRCNSKIYFLILETIRKFQDRL